MKAIPLNVAMALFWAAVNDDYSLSTFVSGYIIGFIVILFLYGRRGPDIASTGRVSPSKLWNSTGYVLRLLWEILLAGITVTRLVFQRGMLIKPGVFTVPADVKGDIEVTLLANSITLTPGTWTLDVPADQGVLYVHALDLPDPAQTEADIKLRLETPIIKASRC